MASGVKIADEAKAMYLEVKAKKTKAYIIYKMNDDNTEVIIEEMGEKGASYEEFVEKLIAVEKKKECRYAHFDCAYKTPGGVEKNKLTFFAWSPDEASIKQKMLYASTKDAFKKAVGDSTKDLQCNDADDLKWDNVHDVISKMDRN